MAVAVLKMLFRTARSSTRGERNRHAFRGSVSARMEKCAQSISKARAVALSIEDRRTDKWREQAANLGNDRIRYLSGRRLREYSPEELGKFQIITDVYGGFSYTEDLSQFLEKVMSALE